MNQLGQKSMVLLVVAVALFTMTAPDSCTDDLVIDTPATVAASGPSSGDHYGCTMEEDCFCCAHIAPVRNFVLPAQITDAGLIISPGDPFLLGGTLVLSYNSYHPPRLFTEIRS